MNPQQQAELQKQYYNDTAQRYNQMHVEEDDEHYFALAIMLAAIYHYEIKSVLDVSAGTGRTMLYLKEKRPNLLVKGIEPSEGLRQIAYATGIAPEDLTDGDATKMQFEKGQFDLVCEFAVLHHIKHPAKAVSEMLRVADKAIFVSDSNNFGQGSILARIVKQLIHSFGLWKAFDLVKTKGKGYMKSEEEGIYYSYSVFDNYRQIRRTCRDVRVSNTQDSIHINPFRGAGHVALLDLKR